MWFNASGQECARVVGRLHEVVAGMAVQPNLASGLAKESYWWHPPTPDPRPHAELLLRRTHRCAFEPDVSEVHVHLGVCGRRVDSVMCKMAHTRLEGTPP